MKRALLVGILCIIILSSVVFSTYQLVEKFSNFPQLNYVVELSPKMLQIAVDDFNNCNSIYKFENNRHFDIMKFERSNQCQGNCLKLTDVYSFDKYYNNGNNLAFTILPENKCILFALPKDKANYADLKLKNFRKATIGYANDIDLEIMKVLFRAMGESLDMNRTKKIDFNGTLSNDLFINTNIDILFIFQNLDFLGIGDGVYVDFLEYDDLDINILNAYAPYIYRKNIVLSDYVYKGQKTFMIKNVCCVDMMLYGDTSMSTSNTFDYELHTINVKLNTYEKVNYYTLYFKFFSQTMKYIADMNTYIGNRNQLPILESFKDNKEVTFDKNVPGFFDSSNGTFETSNIINDIPLSVGDSVHLKAQDRNEENGFYSVTTEYGDTIIMIMLENTKANREREDKYICFNDPSVKSKEFCEADMWDRPCENNLECPFYQANKTYKNYRGGCYNGYCEMPSGVERKAFRTYNQNNYPICHGCDPSDLQCCYTKNKPDYVFPLDTFERL